MRRRPDNTPINEQDGPLGFGGRLRHLRTSRGLYQTELARAIGCTGSIISDWEAGRFYPAFWNLVEITKYFGVDMDWLTGMPYVRNELQERNKVRDQLKGATA